MKDGSIGAWELLSLGAWELGSVGEKSTPIVIPEINALSGIIRDPGGAEEGEENRGIRV